jgi:sugar phosphate isomerase/epimerase
MAKIGVIHYNFPGFSFDDFLKYACDTGYEYVELAISDVWGQDIDNPEKKAEEVLKQLESYNIKASALSAGNDFVLLDDEKVDAQVKRMERICGLAQIVGTNVIRTEGGSPKDSVPEERWAAAITGCLKRCLDFIERDEIYLAVDNHGWVTNNADLQVEIFEMVGSDYVGANLDTMNYRWFGHDLETIDRYYEIIAPYVFHTHMKDGTGSRSEYVGAALGDGEINLEKAAECLRDVGYDGVFCSDYEGREDSAIGYRKCYEWLKTNL